LQGEIAGADAVEHSIIFMIGHFFLLFVDLGYIVGSGTFSRVAIVSFCYWFKRAFCLRSYTATHVFCFFRREIAGADAVEYPVVFMVVHAFAFPLSIYLAKPMLATESQLSPETKNIKLQARVSTARVRYGAREGRRSTDNVSPG